MPAAHHIEQMRLNMEYLGLNSDSLNEIWSTSYLFLGFKVQVMCLSRGGGRGRNAAEMQGGADALPSAASHPCSKSTTFQSRVWINRCLQFAPSNSEESL